MNILLLLVPLSLMLLALAIGAFVWAVKRGQFDDLDTPALDVLADDCPAPVLPLQPQTPARLQSPQPQPQLMSQSQPQSQDPRRAD